MTAQISVSTSEHILFISKLKLSANDDSKMIRIDGAGNFIDLTENNSRKYLYDSVDGYLNVSGGTGPNLEYMLSTNGALLRMTDSTTYAILNCYIRENYEK